MQLTAAEQTDRPCIEADIEQSAIFRDFPANAAIIFLRVLAWLTSATSLYAMPGARFVAAIVDKN